MNQIQANPSREFSPAAVPKPVSPTLTRLIDLRDYQNTTHQRLADLEDRLDSILDQNPIPEASGGATGSPIGPSSLCQNLDDRIGSQRDINSRISALLDRLTV